MIILELFIDFIEKIVSIKVLGIALIEYLIGFLVVITIFKIFDSFVGISRKEKNEKRKKKKESE